MSKNLAAERDAMGNEAMPAGGASVQLALRLRATDHSDRAIVSNVSAVHAASGMVFIDFGFVEQLLEREQLARTDQLFDFENAFGFVHG